MSIRTWGATAVGRIRLTRPNSGNQQSFRSQREYAETRRLRETRYTYVSYIKQKYPLSSDIACSWVRTLPETFISCGLTDVSVLRRNESLSSSRIFMDLELVLAEEFAANTLDVKGPPGSGDEVRKLAKAVYAEVQQGATIRHTLQVVTGRKHCVLSY